MKLLLIFNLLSLNLNHFEINDFINTTISSFLLEYENGNELYINYKKFVSSYESYLFYITYDFHGAHPLTELKTFNYYDNHYIDLNEYLDEKDYIYFSNEAIRVLKPELEKEEMFLEEMFYDGIKPIENNYQNIILDDNYYYIFYEHYQIAPYASGIHMLKVKRY